MVSGQTTPEQPLVDSIFIDQLPVGNVARTRRTAS
jgi:hypothetical protein